MESKRECAIRLLKENGYMNNRLAKEDLKRFNVNFAEYLINVLKQNLLQRR